MIKSLLVLIVLLSASQIFGQEAVQNEHQKLYIEYKKNLPAGFSNNEIVEECFKVVGQLKERGEIYAINEVIWGEAKRATKTLVVYDLNHKLLGYYKGLSSIPKITQLIINDDRSLFFDDENFKFNRI